MGWDFTLTPYDASRWAELERAADAPAELARLLEAAVPEGERDPDLLADLRGDDSRWLWIDAVFADVVAVGPGAFLGRSAHLTRFADAADRRWGERGESLADWLRDIESQPDELLSWELREVEGTRLRLDPDAVKALAEMFRALEPSLSARAPAEVQAAIIAGPGDPEIRGERFAEWALTHFGQVVLHAAEHGHGLCISHDRVRGLRLPERVAGAVQSIVPPAQFTVADVRPNAQQRARTNFMAGLVIGLLIVGVIGALIFLLR
jgi:hypothetical protein